MPDFPDLTKEPSDSILEQQIDDQESDYEAKVYPIFPRLQEYARLITVKKCQFCQTAFGESPIIDFYAHTGGWPVRGIEGLQWLSIECKKCHYKWSIQKLGVPRAQEAI